MAAMDYWNASERSFKDVCCPTPTLSVYISGPEVKCLVYRMLRGFPMEMKAPRAAVRHMCSVFCAVVGGSSKGRMLASLSG